MAACSSEADIEVIEEVEALEATLLEGVTVMKGEFGERPKRLELCLSPLTASDEERAFVSLTLKLDIPLGYPTESPVLSISYPRGLGESSLLSLQKRLSQKCEECLGGPVLYELVELTREFLTDSNVPACSCALCLCDLQEEDSFIKTPCYHYFHSLCYGHLIQSESKEGLPELRCPVCREILIGDLPSYDSSSLLSCPPPVNQALESLTLSKDLVDLQESMRDLFEKQKAKGAIIDIEAENSKGVVSIGGQEGVASQEEVPPKASSSSSSQPLKNKAKPKKPKAPDSAASGSSETTQQEEPRRLSRYKKYQNHNVSRHQMHKNMKAASKGDRAL